MKYRTWNQETGEFCLGMFDVVKLSMMSWSRNFQSLPLVQKFHYLLLRETLVYEINEGDALLDMEPRDRRIPTIILMFLFQQFYGFSIQDRVIILWLFSTCMLEALTYTCWICVEGTWFKLYRRNELCEILQVCLNRFYVQTLDTI